MSVLTFDFVMFHRAPWYHHLAGPGTDLGPLHPPPPGWVGKLSPSSSQVSSELENPKCKRAYSKKSTL